MYTVGTRVNRGPWKKVQVYKAQLVTQLILSRLAVAEINGQSLLLNQTHINFVLRAKVKTTILRQLTT
jgi:hypothetical protein